MPKVGPVFFHVTVPVITNHTSDSLSLIEQRFHLASSFQTLRPFTCAKISVIGNIALILRNISSQGI